MQRTKNNIISNSGSKYVDLISDNNLNPLIDRPLIMNPYTYMLYFCCEQLQAFDLICEIWRR